MARRDQHGAHEHALAAGVRALMGLALDRARAWIEAPSPDRAPRREPGSGQRPRRCRGTHRIAPYRHPEHRPEHAPAMDDAAGIPRKRDGDADHRTGRSPRPSSRRPVIAHSEARHHRGQGR